MSFAGTLAERVTLRERGVARDDLGGADGGWSDGAILWAAVRPDGFGEDGRARCTVTLRARDTAERIAWRGREWRVRRVEADPAVPDRVVWRTEAL